ncbi:hypothetical protein [Aquimarina latercula]|uniref:hypothetical protein n=1 Tax=Aquimarina latercula TaxID=987 RepID=UPI00040E8278|nr:hypothetical protein [Aquimarina latercula]
MKNILLSITILAIISGVKAQDETVNGNLKVTGNIQVTAPGGSWITGKTGTGGIISNTQLTSNAYHPLVRQKTASGHFINLGGLGDYFGFFGYDKDRTVNGYDHSMIMNLNTGNIGIGKNPNAKLDVNGNIHVTTPGSSWITGKTGTGGITSSTQLTSNAYHSLIRQKTASGHFINIGGLGDYFGFFGYDKDRTSNGFDHSMVMDLNSGNVGIGTHNPKTNLEIYQYDGTSQLRVHTNQHAGVAKLEIAGGSALKDTNPDNYSGWSIYHSYINTNKDLYFRHGESGNPNVVFADNGNVAIYGKLESKEIKVSLTPTADFVFEDNYSLPTLEFIENYIKKKKHLPEIASAKEMEKNGVNIGDFQIQLLQKIEELTLYTIAQEKKIKEIESFNKKLLELQSRLEKLESEK